MRYFKRIKDGEVVGMGYLGDIEVLFQMFKDVVEYEQIAIDVQEFIELGIKYDFEGMKPYNVGIPGSI